MIEIKKKKKTKKVIIRGHNPRSNMSTMAITRHIDNPIIESISEPIIVDAPVKEKNKKNQ